MRRDLVIGLDIGTSGARALAMDEAGTAIAAKSAALADHSANRRDPAGWRAATFTALTDLCAVIDRGAVCAIAVDGTSGTMIPVDPTCAPLSEGRMYDDPCEDGALLATIADNAPPTTAAGGATSGLAKALMFQQTPGVAKVLHQADWIAGQLCGVFSSDDNNALKTGYDPVAGRWPDWVFRTGVRPDLLPTVHRPGTPLGPLRDDVATQFDLPASAKVVAGTTDGCAAFLATGASTAGDGVTSLGTTLVLKLLCDAPLFAPEYGIYSHHIMGLWLAGGASNTGGGVLLDHFDAPTIAALSATIDPAHPGDLGYMPLRAPGERFPIADPTLPPQLTPRPADDAAFLKGMLEGIARVEAEGYTKLKSLGAPPLATVRTVGGGAKNEAWSGIRARHLGVPLLAPNHPEAAYGAATLARFGLMS
ncbi:MAG: FGGY-family carbohydrate kinase [Pseudomonadota bacterium]